MMHINNELDELRSEVRDLRYILAAIAVQNKGEIVVRESDFLKIRGSNPIFEWSTDIARKDLRINVSY